MKHKNNEVAIKLAASIMGKKGGSANTEKQKIAHKASIVIARKFLSTEIRKEAQMSIPQEDRLTRAKTAVSARWKKYQKESLVKRPIDNERSGAFPLEFRQGRSPREWVFPSPLSIHGDG